MIGELGGDNRKMVLGCFDEDIKVKENEQRKRRNREEKIPLEEAKVERKIVEEAIRGGKRGARKGGSLVLG